MEQLYLANLAVIERAAAYFCRRYGFTREEVEDFTQHVKLKMLTDDYAVLRKHQGRSSLATYLAMVVRKALQDYVNSLWGKWRPSKQAERLGQPALDLERLLLREHQSFDQAYQTLRSRGVTQTEAELREIAAQLRQPRPSRRAEGWNESSGGGGAAGAHRGEPAAAESADERLWSRERVYRREEALQALAAALQELPPEDCLIAKMVGDGFTIAQIASRLRLPQKPLYKRRDKIFERLREALLGAGISAEDVAEFLDHADT